MLNNTPIWRKKRLADLADDVGGNATLGRVLGFADGAYIGQMIRGTRPITEKLISTIEDLPGRYGWFTPPIDDSTNDKNRDVTNSLLSKSHDESNNYFVIPQFNTGGAMGNGLLLRDQPGVIQGWRVSAEWLKKNVKSHTGANNLCIVTGFGDSMKGMFNSGDPLVIDRGVKIVEFDGVYFFRVGDEGFIKRLQRIPGEGIRVLSENKKYESWTIKPEMNFEVFGRVLKAWQGEEL